MRFCLPRVAAASRSLRALAWAVLALGTTVALGRDARAATDVCYEGGSLLPNFKLNGNADLNGTDLIVTQSLGNQRSSLMYYPKFSAATDFHIELEIEISKSVNGGADGMAFVMHNDPAGPSALGASGQGIGYQGITNSVVVEFDTFQNGGDPNANHIAITKGGDPVHTDAVNAGLPVVSDPNGIDLKSGNPIYIWIDYGHTLTTLSVYIASTATKPTLAAMTSVIDLSSAIGSTFYAGFTGSTGGSWSQHEVLQLFASDHFANPQDGCCATSADCASSASGPVCDPAKHLCGTCTEANTSGCPAATPACDLSSSSDQCIVACNGDNGSAATHACASASFPACTSGGTCATCNGDFQTASTVTCAVGAPFCSPTGYCGLCTQNSDCTTSNASHVGAFCDTTSGACVGCNVDADCSAVSGTYCNGTTNTCVATLPNGTAIPNDPLHTATCTQATGAAVCSSGVCDTADNHCGLATGDGTCTLTTQCRAGVCVGSGANSGKCEPCVADGSCPGGACNTTTNQCVVCTATNAAACTAGTPVCDVASNTCDACNGDNGSTAAEACPTSGNPFCAAGGACGKCTANTDCTTGTHAGAICNLTTGACGTSCTIDSDCPGQWCDNPTATAGGGTCAAKLANGDPVPSDAPIGGTCTSAVGTRVCATGVCDTGDNLCGEPNDRTCASVAVCRSAVCNADGKCGDPNGTACTNATTCRTGACDPDGKCGERGGEACTSAVVCRSDICVGSDGACGALPGAPCAAATDCRSGVCATDGRCGSPNGDACTAGTSCRGGACTGGMCSGHCATDAQCAAGAFCDAPSQTCLPDLANGSSCTRIAQCASAVCSADGKCGDLNGTACASPVTCRSSTCSGGHCGANCTADADCAMGSHCGAGTCTPGLTNGQTCNTSTQCLSGVCASDGKCGALAAAPCATPAVCRSGICDATSTCVATCATDTDCRVGSYCDATTHACVTAASNGTQPGGHACARGPQCQSGDCDTDGICGGANGEACGTALLCRSAACNLADTSCGPATADAGVADSGEPDAGDAGDASLADGGEVDAGEPDATVDASPNFDATAPGTDGGPSDLRLQGGGCNCTTAGGSSPTGGLSGLGAALALLAWRTRRRTSRRDGNQDRNRG